MATAILNRRVIVGWRTESINRVLDACAAVPWGVDVIVDIDRPVMPDSLGRLQKKWYSDSERLRQLRLTTPDYFIQRKEREREKMIADYEIYCQQYMSQFPDSKPVTYWVFSKKGLASKWRKDPKLAVLSSYRIPSEIEPPVNPKIKPPKKIV